MKPKINYLIPQLDKRKSFYCKAWYIVKGKKTILYSFDSKVCEIENGDYKLNTKIRKDLLFSTTTMRHIREFLSQKLDLIVNRAELLKKAGY